MTDTCVEFAAVSKSLGAGIRVLDDVDLVLPTGATAAVIGESGSGKTTLLQHINALLDPDRGQVRVFGAPIPDDRVAFRRRIGYSVQGAGLFPHMTNRDNVVLLARLEGWRANAIEQRYCELITAMGLSDDISARYPVELSGGQQQRVGLCRALMLQPRLLLLDEPFSAIDPITRGDIYRHFQRIQRQEAISTVLVTHDMREAVRLASWLVIMQCGRILQSGPTDAVRSAPADDYVAQLLTEQLE